MKKDLVPGLYEALLTAGLKSALDQIDPSLKIQLENLRAPEAPDRISLHVGRVVMRAIQKLPEKDRSERGAELATALLRVLEQQVTKFDVSSDLIPPPASTLVGIVGTRLDGSAEELSPPLIPILDTTLLTNAPGEPRVGRQVLSEIHSADSIDVLMAFVRLSGLRPLVDALRKHCSNGRRLRVLTTTYTKTTEPAALDLLEEIGAQVRVSYDNSTTRLHAKAWLFERHSGYSTAYIGSSNLTYSAQVDGIEWNVRLSGARNPDVIEKIQALFESSWEADEFEPYNAEKFAAAVAPASPVPANRLLLAPFELKPKPFQERLLEKIRMARDKGRHRNLLVSATGTGKTVMAALDYALLRETLPRARLLFVAHRKEILEQSLSTFCHCLRDQNFGQLWTGEHRPDQFEHVFASIQTLSRANLSQWSADHFDVVIVDEFHHAAAKSYKALLDHVRPRELLGLTATPERADGLPVLGWFENRIAAELRLWDAIEQHQLAPFVYFGVHDGYDLKDIPWKRGTGYDVAGLTNVYTANDGLARGMIRALADRVDNVQTIRALGFCVSVDHARYMARIFNEAGLDSVAIWGNTPSNERAQAIRDLTSGKVRVVFSVDLFNEGVDVPKVDTLLLLRPTDSATLFLQQIGRGLRKSDDKRFCTILDFVGLHRREYRFENKLRALLGGSRTDVRRQVESGFPFLPAGCHMELDAVSQKQVLRNLKEAIPSSWPARIRELVQLSAGSDVTLAQYLESSGLDLGDLYQGHRTWSDLREAAGLAVASAGPHEATLRRAIGRLLHTDDPGRVAMLRRFENQAVNLELPTLDERDRRQFRMLAVSVLDQKLLGAEATIADAVACFNRHPQVLAELSELAPLLELQIDHLQPSLPSHPDLPLRVHARYSRLEIQAAFNNGAKELFVPPWREGVRWLPDEKADLFVFTLDKTSGGFSPTTRYRDYAISPSLIHWESQSTTSETSPTGQRYQNHFKQGSTVMLFARLRSDDRAFWFLGPARYVSHRSDRPMQITWRLEHDLPGDLYAAFAAAM